MSGAEPTAAIETGPSSAGPVLPRQRAATPGRVTRNFAALGASQAITWSLTLVWTLVVPRLLGPSSMGLMTTAISTTAILGLVVSLPARDYIARELVARPAERRALLGTAFALRFSGVPVFVAGIVAYEHIADLGPHARAVLWLTAAATLLTLVAEPALAAFQAVERMEFLASYDVLSKTLVSLGGVALALAGVGVVGLTGFGLAAALLSFVVAAVWLRRLVGIRARTTRQDVVGMARASAPYWSFGIFYLVYLWVDAAMLGLMVPAEVVGWYGVASKLFTTLMFLPVLVATVSLPGLVRAHENGWESLIEAARLPLQAVGVVALPVAAGTALIAGEIVPLAYGQEYSGAAPVLAVLACCLPCTYVSIMLNQVLIAAGRPLVWTWVMLGATVVNPLLNLLLIPWTQESWGNGAIGAAVALLFTESFVVAAGSLIVGRHVIDREGLWRFGRSILATVVMACSVLVVAGAGLPAMLFVGTCSWVGAAVCLRVITAAELSALRSAFGGCAPLRIALQRLRMRS